MVLINGCSFTDGSGLHNPLSSYSVDYCIQRSLPYTNIAITGSSNDNIRSTTISELLDKSYKFVMVNWTTPWRLVLGKLIPTETPVKIMPKFAYNGDHNDNSNYIDLDKFWLNFYDGFYYHRNYFESVFLLQEFCRTRGIGYVFTNTNNFMQISSWQKISSILKNSNDHPDTYTDQFTGSTRDQLSISYQRLYKNHTATDIKNSFRRITSYVDAIDWSQFVGLDQEPFFDWPNQKWPTELDHIHPGKEAHLHWRKILDRSSWLTEKISKL